MRTSEKEKTESKIQKSKYRYICVLQFADGLVKRHCRMQWPREEESVVDVETN